MIRLAKTNELFSAVRWVTLARSTDGAARPALLYVKIEADRFLATDGHRLHMYTPGPYTDLAQEIGAPGLYEVIKCTKSEVFLESALDAPDYPQYERVIPDTSKYLEFAESRGKTSSPVVSRLICKAARALHAERGVNYAYLKDFVDISETVSLSAHSEKDIGGVIALKSEFCTGVLMPILLEGKY